VVREGRGLETLVMFAMCMLIPYSGINDAMPSGVINTDQSSNFIDKHLPQRTLFFQEAESGYGILCSRPTVLNIEAENRILV
jgi:hypothetical protein